MSCSSAGFLVENFYFNRFEKKFFDSNILQRVIERKEQTMIQKYPINPCKDGRHKGQLNVVKRENAPMPYSYFYAADAEKLKQRLSEEDPKRIKGPDEKNLTFDVLFQHWLRERAKKVRKSSLSIYHCYIESHFQPLLGEECTMEITAEKLEEIFKCGLRFRKDGKGELAIKSQIDLLRTLNHILRFGVKQGYMEHLIQLEYPKTEKSSIHVLREPEQRRFERCLQEDIHQREALGIYLCLYTGLRVGELCGLQWGDLDLEYGILHVRQTVQRISTMNTHQKTEVIVGSPKSQSSFREIPIPDHLLRLLKQLKKGDDDAYFLSDTNRCFEPRRMQRVFSDYLEKAGLPHRGFHCTRHTFATRWVELGADIKTLSEILGHRSIQIILDKYVHISEKTKRENINKIQPLCIE